MLLKFELKKMLVTYRGLLILLICFFLKTIIFLAIPEQKDSRILLSQNQYDKYLQTLYGENTPEKTAWIRNEFSTCKNTCDLQETMQISYHEGKISEQEWLDYTEKLRQAELRLNSAGMFAEKAEQFACHPEKRAPAWYIYEYGWQTVYTILQFPDIFLLFGVLLLAAQSIPGEIQNGMLPILLCARDGRRKLIVTKFIALLLLTLTACIISIIVEVSVFSFRGWFQDGHVPLYSITLLTDSYMDISLIEGYLLCLVTRTVAILLGTALLFGLSVWVRSSIHVVFLGVCGLIFPLLWHGNAIIYLHGGLLLGTRIMCLLQTASELIIPLVIMAAYTAIVVISSIKRYCKGL